MKNFHHILNNPSSIVARNDLGLKCFFKLISLEPISSDVIKNEISLKNQVFQAMESKGIQPTSMIYNSMINVCARHGDTSQALFYFENLKRRMDPDIYTMNTLLKAFSRKKVSFHFSYCSRMLLELSNSFSRLKNSNFHRHCIAIILF